MLSDSVAPPRIRPGDTVAVVSPSFPAVGRWPHRVERGTSYLESLGLKVKLMPNAAGSDGWVSAPARARAADINDAFADDEVSVVLAGLGGNHSNQIVDHLDFDLVRANPKLFHGYSDITYLHWALLGNAGLRTFYGSMFTGGLAEYPAVLGFTDRFVRSAWFGDEPIAFAPAEQWTDEFLDWDDKADLTRPRAMRPSTGWLWIRDGRAQGPLLGGCLETICWHLKGSSEWIDPAGAIFFLETSEEAPSPGHVDAYLTDLDRLGVFERAAALVFARPANYSDEDTAILWKVVEERTAGAGIPVLANVDCGHADPMLTLPMGAPARLDSAGSSFGLTEPATRA